MPELDPTRERRITASQVSTLLSGDHYRIQNLWLRIIGDERYVPDDFSSSWAARYGLHVEPLALDFHQEATGMELVERGEQFFHPSRPFVSATLDAFRPVDSTVVDVKCVHCLRDIDEATAFYVPQMLVQLECRQALNAALLFVKGGAEPFEVPVYIDADFRAAVWQKIDEFWHCVESLTPPVPLLFPRIVAPSEWRFVDLDGDDPPNWSPQMRELLAEWDTTRETAHAHERVKIEIKSLISDHIGEVVCGCYSIKRDRRNALTVRMRGG